MPDARRFQERILRLENEATFGKEASGRRSHREDSADPRTQQADLRLSEGARRVEGAWDSLLSQTGRETHAPERAAGLHARQEERGTTRRGKRSTAAEDLIKRKFAATEVDKVWAADITYVATAEGYLYLAFILDVHSRRIVGWAMEDHLRSELVVDALRMAVWRRKPAPGLVHHSDQGVQYTALSFSERLREVDIIPSMGRTGSALDNAIAESFVSTLKAELVSGLQFPSRQAAKTAIFEYLETFYNTRRLHSSLGYRSPSDFEEDRIEGARVA